MDYVTHSWRVQTKRKRRTSKHFTGNKSTRYTMSMKLNSIIASVILVCYNSKMIWINKITFCTWYTTKYTRITTTTILNLSQCMRSFISSLLVYCFPIITKDKWKQPKSTYNFSDVSMLFDIIIYSYINRHLCDFLFILSTALLNSTRKLHGFINIQLYYFVTRMYAWFLACRQKILLRLVQQSQNLTRTYVAHLYF